MRLALRSPAAVVDEPLVDVRLHDRNHSLDWASAFTAAIARSRSWRQSSSTSLRPLLRRERARNAAGLVSEHVRRREHRGPARLVGGAAHAWPQPEWWWRALRAAAGSYLRGSVAPLREPRRGPFLVSWNARPYVRDLARARQ